MLAVLSQARLLFGGAPAGFRNTPAAVGEFRASREGAALGGAL